MDTLADFIIGYFVVWSVLAYDDFSSISKTISAQELTHKWYEQVHGMKVTGGPSNAM